MHAVLLAAGVGRRLNAITGGGPKCLLPFGGASLLERHLAHLDRVGVERLTVVTGCEAMQIEQALGALVPETAPAMTVDTVQNPDFRLGSALSVAAARDAPTGETDILLMDADVLYDPAVLEALVYSAGDNVCLLDRGVDVADPEPVKLCLRAGTPVGLDKELPAGLDYDTVGESVGFFRLTPASWRALFEACGRLAAADQDTPHEHALREVMLAAPECFGVEDVTGLPWIEIDYPEDVERAQHVILARMEATS